MAMIDLTDVTFLAMMVATIGGAISALEAREIVYGAIGLAFSFFGVAAILLMVALLAVLIPARRTISLDPVAALRSE